MVVIHIARDMKHPGLEIPLSAKEVTIFQYPEENILHQIFAEFRIFGHSIKKAEQRLFITLEEQAKLVEVSLFYLEHQGIIR